MRVFIFNKDRDIPAPNIVKQKIKVQDGQTIPLMKSFPFTCSELQSCRSILCGQCQSPIYKTLNQLPYFINPKSSITNHV